MAYIVLALLALLALLLFAPVGAEFVWRQEELRLTLRLLWLFPLRVLPAPPREKKPKRKKRPKKAKKQKQPSGPPAPPPPKKGPAEQALELLQLVNDLLPTLSQSCGYILGRATISRCRIALVVSGGRRTRWGSPAGGPTPWGIPPPAGSGALCG